MINGLEVATKFHEAYERMAPSFGYETRKDTKAFDPDSANGRLMIAVCEEVVGQMVKSAYEAGVKTGQGPDMSTAESLPEKVDEWDGWDAYEFFFGTHLFQLATFETKQFIRDKDYRGGASEWQLWGARNWEISSAPKLHGPTRLEVLTSLPDDLVKAAKGVGNAK